MKMKEKSTNSQRQIYMGILAVFMAVTFLLFMGKDECTCRREHIQWIPL